MDSEFWAAVAGAIVGAVAGGGLTWALQWHQDTRQTLERDKALARSLIFKLMRIYSDFYGLRKHVEECADRAKKDGLPEGWQSLRPIANLPPQVSFTPDEMSYLLSLKNFDLFNKVISLDVVHASTMGIFDVYAARRMALTDGLSASMQGMVGTSTMNDEQYAVFAPKAAELDLLAADIRVRVEQDCRDSREAVIKANEAVSSTLGHRLDLEIPL